MRICESCARPDSCIVDYETKCGGKCDPRADERSETHHDSCPKLTHEVRLLLRVAKLVNTPAHPEGELERKYSADGWKIRKDGRDVFRTKMLCRACIQAVCERDQRQKEYETACKRALGQDTQTYSQMLAQQSF